MNKKNYDITIKEFSKTKLPKAEAPETYVMDTRINFNLSEEDFKYLISKLNKKNKIEASLIKKLGSLFEEQKAK